MKNLMKNHRILALSLILTLAFSFSLATDAVEPDEPLTSQTFVKIAEKAAPSVVYVKVERSITITQHRNPFDMFGRDFFERFFPERFRDDEEKEEEDRSPREREYRQEGEGSGVVISEDGYILTNHHVVGEADRISVKLNDGRQFEAELIGTDPESDVGVIKIEVNNLQPIPLGDSDDIKVGEWVVAIGNPFGLSNSVSTGIISAKGRSNIGIVDYEDFIQTDAAINPGNSGGPLLNLQGEMIGINTAIFSRSGGYMGIGFSIPINMAKVIYEQLKDTGTITRGYLGIWMQDLTSELAESFDLDENQGVVISEVVPDSPAAEAGFQTGDVIIEFEGKPVQSAGDLRNWVAMISPETKIEMVVIRNGSKQTLTPTIAKRDESAIASREQGEEPEDKTILNKIGINVQNLSPDLAEQFDYDEEQGVIITEVEAYSPAARQGIRPGTLIIEVNREPVADVDQFISVAKKAIERGNMLLLIKQGERSRYVPLKFNE